MFTLKNKQLSIISLEPLVLDMSHAFLNIKIVIITILLKWEEEIM